MSSSPLPPATGGFAWLWVPVLAYMGLIFALSSIPDVPAPPGGLSDKTVHGLLYGGFGLLLVRALARGARSQVTIGVAVTTVVIAAAYGLSDEFHQLFVPHREFDLRDLAADVIGAALAAGGAWAWSIIRRRTGSL